MPSKLESRIAKLEKQRQPKRIKSHVLIYKPDIPGSFEAALRHVESPFMVVRDFGTPEEWEKAAMAQQRKLCGKD